MTIRVVDGEGMKQLEALLNGLSNPNLVGKVGWFEKNKYPGENPIPVAYVATIQEYGYPPGNIPARPFLRPTIIEKQAEWQQVVLYLAKGMLNGTENQYSVLDKIGMIARGNIQEKIASIFSPPLSPRTIQARLNRKSDKKTIGALTKPLIDTGIMIGSVTNVVEVA